MSQTADRELIDTIVRQVLAAMPSQTGGGARASTQAAGCAPTLLPPVPPVPRGSEAPTRKVFLTADDVAGRIASDGSSGGFVELAPNEILTPNAQDLLGMRGLSVHKAPKAPVPSASASCATAPSGGGGLISAGAPGGTIGIILHRPNAQTEGMLASVQRDGVPLAAFDQADCWMLNLRAMCEAVSAGRIAAGVAILPYAADAMLLAGKVCGIRAVQGTRPASVEAALRHFDANVLVLEHAFSTPHELRRMIGAFAARKAAAAGDTALIDAVAEIERA